MVDKEHAELNLMLLTNKFKKCKERLIQSIELRSAYIIDPSSCSPPSVERVQQMMLGEQKLQETMDALAFAVKIMRWVLSDDRPQSLELF